MSDFLEVALRTIGGFVLFMLVARALGKQTISQMTLHDFIAAISLGAIIGNLTFNLKIEAKYIVTAFIIFGTISYFATIASRKSRKMRKWLSGAPTVLIQEGQILEGNMKKINYTLDYLNQALREKDIFDIEEVEYCTLESDGHISVLKKFPYRTLTKQDIGIFVSHPSSFPVELIMDGQIIDKNLVENQLSKEWLFNEIENRGVALSDICYAVRGTNKQLYFDFYQDQISNPIDQE
ncbi:DUF421 domain-containing protein [Ammoniphilus sp. YIM 78166]|uniref:DUF421 domain-containing protein n=1 Tax=Ammoniphilus sp. YIM 78166 TaxID=1644106 RepID=UPI0010700751|nr:DUF421 domain-containing protein [Ammoniphilus sp. YIM 78166]